MNTEALIESLANDVKAVSPHSISRRLLLGILGGGSITLLLVVGGLGLRSDIFSAMCGFSFWMKAFYTSSLGVGAIIVVARLARPEPVLLRRFWPIAIPFALLAIACIVEMAGVPPGRRAAMWLGHSWTKCPWLVFVLSVPIFVGLLWSFRRLAPSQLRAASAAAGLAAGAWAAALYCLHCPEASAAFVLTWYTLGIGLAAALGALIGPRFLRW